MPNQALARARFALKTWFRHSSSPNLSDAFNQKHESEILHVNRVGKHFPYLALSLMDKIWLRLPDIV